MKRNHKFYRKNESKVMRSLGFRPTKNSGSGWIEKEDGISEHCICQLKSTDNSSISVKKRDLDILKYNANISNKIPVFAIQFLDTDDIWLMIRPDDIQSIKGITCGEYKKNSENTVISIDSEQDICYNNVDVRKSVNAVEARKKYLDETEKERERRKESYKRRIKKNCKS